MEDDDEINEWLRQELLDAIDSEDWKEVNDILKSGSVKPDDKYKDTTQTILGFWM